MTAASPKYPTPTVSVTRRASVLILLLLIYMSSYLDRTVLGLLQQPIKTELRLTDSQLGLLNGPTFALFYATLGMPSGRLAERHNRPLIIIISLVLWSVMTVMCGLAGTFPQLLALRVGVA